MFEKENRFTLIVLFKIIIVQLSFSIFFIHPYTYYYIIILNVVNLIFLNYIHQLYYIGVMYCLKCIIILYKCMHMHTHTNHFFTSL